MGAFASYFNSNYRNTIYSVSVKPAVEYNIFPWDISDRKVFTIAYYIGPEWKKYYEETVYGKLEEGLWEETFRMLDRLRLAADPQDEREVADFIDARFKGFGPKQSRNLLQSLGLTRYEIPIDSRITKWLNRFGFPVKLSAEALSDSNYYRFVSEGFQRLCAESETYPCVLDAAIFASYDKGGWSEENVIW